MLEDWFEPVHLDDKIATAQKLFAEQIAQANDPRAHIVPKERDPGKIGHFIAYLSELLCKTPERSSFKYERPDRAMRQSLGIEYSNHAFNKRFRLLNRMSAHLSQYRQQMKLAGFRIAGKAGLVTLIDRDAFVTDIWSAAFIAYFIARKRRRSTFTNQSQSRAFDDFCELLLEKAKAGKPNWFLIAHVYPEREILDQLTDEEKGILLGQWTVLLRDISLELERVWQTSSIDLENMIVKRGNDSSTWNTLAQTWNTARQSWIALNQSMGSADLFEKFLPGKVLRLMAADVAGWHLQSGGKIHPDTLVWRSLPHPWHVMQGQDPCTRDMVERACRQAGIDPAKSGWTYASINSNAEEWSATPELVHGVAVTSPEVAGLLRKAGIFSGKPLKRP